MKAVIAVDVGTTSTRAILFSDDGTILSEKQIHNQPEYLGDGRVEQNPETWKGTVIDLLQWCSQYSSNKQLEFRGISITASRSSVIPVDSSGRPLSHAIMWQDKRTDDLVTRLEHMNPIVFQKTGQKITSVFSAIKMKWIKDNLPDIYNMSSKLVGIQDFLINALTGSLSTDETFAGRTNLYNLEEKCWDPELLDIFGIEEEKLCSITKTSTVAGYLHENVASATGLQKGLPVVTAGGDQQCAALGSGLLSREQVIANTGTGSYVIGWADQPVIDKEMRVLCNPSSFPGKYILEAPMLSTGSVYRWLNSILYPESSSFSAIDEEAASSTPGANGVILLPYFKGAGAPHWNPDANGVFQNLQLSTSRGDLARATLESIALDISENIDLMEELSGPVKHVVVSGGMSRSAFFNQIQADVYSKRVIAPENREATAFGAWISATTALGLYTSMDRAYQASPAALGAVSYETDPNMTHLYNEVKKKRKLLYGRLYP